MKKFFVISLLNVMLSILAFGQSASFNYQAKVVNVSSSLNIRERESTKSAVVGKLQNGDIVNCSQNVELIDNRNTWVNIQYGSVTGYVKASYLEKYIELPSTGTPKYEPQNNAFLKFYKGIHYYFILALSILIFVLAARKDHSKSVVFTMLAAMTILFVAVFTYQPGRELEVFDGGGAHWFSRLVNLIIVGVSMCASIVGYLSTSYGLADVSTNSYEDYQNVSISFFLWLTPLLVVCLYFPIGFIVVLPLALWKFGLNCKLMWPKVHIPIIILVLGIFTCMFLLKQFIAIITQVIVACVFGILILAFLKGSATSIATNLFSGNTDNEDSSNNNPYKEEWDAEAYDEAGHLHKLKDEGFGRWKDDDGHHWRDKGTFGTHLVKED